MRVNLWLIVFLAFLTACLGMKKEQHAPDDVNLRYMYITVYPDEATLTVTVEFKDGTPTFRDTKITKIHEPVLYSVDARKVKRIHVVVKKTGWVTQEKEWLGEVPFDVFIKLNTVP